MASRFDCIIDRTASDSVKWGRYGEDVIALWVADLDFRSPEAVVNALRARVEHGVYGYAWEPKGFRELLVDRTKQKWGWDIEPEWIVFTPGVVTAFNQAIHGLTEPGDGLMIHTPVYGPILRAHNNAGLISQPVALAPDASGRYEIDFDAMEAAVTPETKLFLLCNPHNPVGRVFDRDELTALAAFCERHDLTIISDEIHNELLMADNVHVPIAALSPEVAARTITLMAPSKTFNIAGLQCSVTIISDAGMRERYAAGGQGLVEHVSVMGWTGAQAAYKHGQPWLDEMLAYLTANRDYLKTFVDDKLPGINMWSPEGTYLAWLNVQDVDFGERTPLQFFLEEAKVGLQAGTDFGGEGYLRLNYGTCRATLAQALDQMAEALGRL